MIFQAEADALKKRQELSDRNVILIRSMAKLLQDAQPPLGFTAKILVCIVFAS